MRAPKVQMLRISAPSYDYRSQIRLSMQRINPNSLAVVCSRTYWKPQRHIFLWWNL